ncbi:sugar ABC transporter substrate-binding protein [Microbacterium capsulatum]|uniref:Sugar ABC transporter substrate-binding protein n=1 Tax=Microbacterium capsulatum TaxID=3041921 RepID=A0ABU0XCQ6_9MICO|nr:sugar ABC transporter substrate-binding protein [Microbacterium sp. ASV81]MDQ4212871.1 sugar ABC transporter substrate-binding protein [Microbacterium sp. ASV81]
MKKSLLAAGAALAVGALVLSGCSSSGSAAADSGKVTITYSNFIANGGNEKNLQAIVDAFHKANPDITVKITTTDYANYFTKLQTDLSAGTQADVFDVDAGSFHTYADQGVLAQLKDVKSAAYRKSVLDTYAVDGKQYGLPTSFSDVVLFYNKDLFDKAGVAVPTANWTWKDEQAAAQKLTAAGVWGDYQPVSYFEYYKAVAQAGGSFLSKDGKKSAFNSPQGIAAAEWLAGKSGKTMPTAADGAGTADFDTNLFKSGKLAMWHSGIWMFSTLGKLPFNWDVAVEPGDTSHASAMFSNAAVVSASSKHAAAAQKFAEFLTTSKEMVQTRLDAGWELPAVSDEAALKPYLSQTPPANRPAVFDSLEKVALNPILGPNAQQIQDAVSNALGEIAAGRQKAADAIPALAKTVDGLLAR